jgi:hypothetical protein
MALMKAITWIIPFPSHPIHLEENLEDGAKRGSEIAESGGDGRLESWKNRHAGIRRAFS